MILQKMFFKLFIFHIIFFKNFTFHACCKKNKKINLDNDNTDDKQKNKVNKDNENDSYNEKLQLKDEYKSFVFIKNSTHQKSNRCWFVSTIIGLANIPYVQNYLIKTNFKDEDKDFIVLKNAMIKLINANDKDEYVNLDPEYLYFATKFNCVDEPFYPFRLYTILSKISFLFNFRASFNSNDDYIKNKIDSDVVEKYFKHTIFVEIIKKTLNIDIYNFLCNPDKPKFNDENSTDDEEDDDDKNEYPYTWTACINENYPDPTIFLCGEEIDIFEEECKKEYKCITKEYFENHEKNVKHLITTHNLEINSIIFEARDYHFFVLCKDNANNNWYNYDSLSNKNGTLSNDLIEEFKKNGYIKIGSTNYYPLLYLCYQT